MARPEAATVQELDASLRWHDDEAPVFAGMTEEKCRPSSARWGETRQPSLE
jgi:hypothetical protein